MRTIGSYIQMYRKMNKLTQDNLAEIVNVTRQQIGNYEGDKTDPPAEILVAISNALNVTPNDLLRDYIQIPPPSSDLNQQLYQLFSEMNPYELRLLARTAKLILDVVRLMLKEGAAL